MGHGSNLCIPTTLPSLRHALSSHEYEFLHLFVHAL